MENNGKIVGIRNSINIQDVCLTDIDENIVNLRTIYGEEELVQLASSFESDGLLQPIIVAPSGESRYELIIGSRRLRAAKINNWLTIPALVVSSRLPLDYLFMALSENLQRQDLNIFEEASAFLRLIKEYGLSEKEIAEKIHRHHSYITKRIKLLTLPKSVQGLIAEKRLGFDYVDMLARLPDGVSQLHYAQKVLSDKLTRDELKELIQIDNDNFVVIQLEKRTVHSYGKVRIRISIFTRWIKKVITNKALLKSINSVERAELISLLKKLETEVRTSQSVFGQLDSVQRHTLVPNTNYDEPPDNHRDEWSLRAINQITAQDRPSDEELSVKLGRTVGAIRGMRNTVQREKKIV